MPQKVTVDQIADALIVHRGVVTDAAEDLGVQRENLSRRISRNKRLREIRDEMRVAAKDEVVDLAESKIYKLISDPSHKHHATAVIFTLKCHGKERGWVERQEITGKGGDPIGQVAAPVRQMSAEEWRKENLKVVTSDTA